jgi:ferritin-like metal-binding protein YciE
MATLNTLRDALVEELKDVYSAEKQLLKALPQMEKKASNADLKSSIGLHITETETQIQRLTEIGEILKEKLTGKTCMAMQGLVEEGKSVLEEKSNNKALLDTLLIGACQRVEHYELAAYGVCLAMASELGEIEVVTLLEQSLAEEHEALDTLTAIAEGGVLSMANSDAKQGKAKSDNHTGRALMALFALLFAIQFTSLALAENDGHHTDEQKQIENEKKAMQYRGDNSGANARDNNTYRKTADDQNLTGDSTEILSSIRREIVANDDLSTNAHNVKIMVENNKVLLRGPVDSVEEKEWIAEATAKVAPKMLVVNELEVIPS